MTPWILKADKLDKHFFLHEQARQIPSTFQVDLELFPGQLQIDQIGRAHV